MFIALSTKVNARNCPRSDQNTYTTYTNTSSKFIVYMDHMSIILSCIMKV